jgi:large subunit ribosomal protein L15
MTKFHELEVSANKSIKRVGRGIASGQGKTAGRGTKGQKSRTGKKLRPMFAGGSRTIAKATPKLKGFKSLKTKTQVVYLDNLNTLDGASVDNFKLMSAGLIDTPYQAVKVIARGELTAKIDLQIAYASASVKQALTSKGGSFTKTAVPLQPSTKTAEK